MPDDRDVLRPKTPSPAVRAQTASPEVEIFEDCTGKYEGEELAQARAKRPTAERLGKLEVKHDALAKDVTETRVAVGRIEGRLDGQDKVLEEIRSTLHNVTAREHVVFTRDVEIGTAEAKAEIAVETAEKVTTIKDEASAKEHRRKRLTKLVGAVLGLLGSGALIAELVRLIAGAL